VVGLTPNIVVDGKSFEMKPSPLGGGLHEFEYQLPAGRDRLAYYFLVTYNVEGNGVLTPREAYTQVETVQIVRRYVLSLEVNRGPVGSRISVVGRGFTPQDVIQFNGSPARTAFESPNSISFFVPALEANRNYQVAVASAAGTSPVGTFRIDPSSITVSPSALTLRSGERTSGKLYLKGYGSGEVTVPVTVSPR